MVHGCSQVSCGLDKYKDEQICILEFMVVFFSLYQKLTLVYFSFDTLVIYKSLIIQAGVIPIICIFLDRDLFVLLRTFVFV